MMYALARIGRIAVHGTRALNQLTTRQTTVESTRKKNAE